MARKVFLSVLGTGYYNKTTYYLKDKTHSFKTRFIQEATLKLLPIEWSENDKVIIFLTEKARKSNWESPAQTEDYRVKNGERDTYIGLKDRIMALNQKFQIIDKDIPDGNNEEEIWEIFNIVYNSLEENDELYFDITHAFRSLPMLIIVLINYAKFLKKIKVEKITYGNFEGKDENNFSPIIDLTSFSELQDWANAANTFVKFGNFDDVASLLPDDQNIKILKFYFKGILSVRGKNIIRGMKLTKVKKSLRKNYSYIEPFNILSDEILKKIAKFKDNNISNGFAAIEFCIKHNFIQQGITLLEEFIITKVLEDIGKKEKIHSYRYRLAISKALENDNINDVKIPKLLPEKYKESLKNELEELLNNVFNLNYKLQLTEIYKEFSTSIRNDINHAGFRDNPKSETELKKFLEESYTKVKELLNIK